MAAHDRSLSRRGFVGVLGLAATFLSCACGRARAQHSAGAHEPIPGADKSARSTMLGMGAELLQNEGPIGAINMYLNGFHFYADDMGRQIEAHHYCTHVNEDFFQCVIYDGNGAQARLIGVEYIVSERLFGTLPEEEKALWHSHRHETTSGELVMPGIPKAVETMAMADLATTYGKTWHTWQIDREAALPLGIPQLMMGFTADGQLRRAMIESRDERLGVSAAAAREARADLARATPPPAPGADAWQGGTSPQLVLAGMPVKNRL
jgi:hypothetical protein